MSEANDHKPMERARLLLVREMLEHLHEPELRARVAELLADRDYQAQRAEAAEQGEPNSWRLDTLRRLAGLPEDATWSSCIVRVRRNQRERDEAVADVARLRARVRVEAADVERARVTLAHVERWLCANGWGAPTHDEYGWTSAESETGGEPVDLWRTDGSTPLDVTVRFIADDVQRPDLDILEEMAAMPLEAAP